MTSLLDLPTEVLGIILTYLPSCSDFYSLNRVNKHLHAISSSPTILRTFSYHLYGPEALLLLATYRSQSFIQSFHATLVNEALGLANGMLYGFQTEDHAMIGMAIGTDPGKFGKEEIHQLQLNYKAYDRNLRRSQEFLRITRMLKAVFRGSREKWEQEKARLDHWHYYRVLSTESRVRLEEDVRRAMYNLAILACQCHHRSDTLLSFKAGLQTVASAKHELKARFRSWLRMTRQKRPESWGPSLEIDTVGREFELATSKSINVAPSYKKAWLYVYDYTYVDSLSLNELLRILAVAGNELNPARTREDHVFDHYILEDYVFDYNILKEFFVAKFLPIRSSNDRNDPELKKMVETVMTAIACALCCFGSEWFQAQSEAVKTMEKWQKDVDPAYYMSFLEKKEVDFVNSSGRREKKEILALRGSDKIGIGQQNMRMAGLGKLEQYQCTLHAKILNTVWAR